MKKTNALYCITAGNPKKLIKPVVWTVLADLVNLFPFCLLALVVGSIYQMCIRDRRWVGLMNTLKAQVEEIIFQELISV